MLEIVILLLLLSSTTPVDNIFLYLIINKLDMKSERITGCINGLAPVGRLWINSDACVVHCLSTSSCQSSQQIQIIVINAAVGFSQSSDTAAAVQNRCMVTTTERITYLRKTMIGPLLRVGDLLSKRRTRSIARPRQVAMALSKELTNHSLPEIGDAFGGRDHTTVLHGRAIDRVRRLDSKSPTRILK